AFPGCSVACSVEALSAALGGFAWGGAAPSASLRMMSWKRSLDQVSQSTGASAACGWLFSGGALGVGVAGVGAGVAWLSRRTTDLYSWVERWSHLDPHDSSPPAGWRR